MKTYVLADHFKPSRESFSVIAVAMLSYIAICAGRFPISRISGYSDLPFYVDEVRTWVILLLFLFLANSWRQRTNIIEGINTNLLKRSVSIVIGIQLILVAHALLTAANNHTPYFIWDLIVTICICVLLLAAYILWGKEFVYLFLMVAFLAALVFAIWALVTILRPSDLNRPLATTYTFYRIQLLGGFSALACIQSDKIISLKNTFLGIIGIICFSTAYMTLSKAALIVGNVGLLFLAAIYFTWFSKKIACLPMVVAIVASVLFFFASGHSFATRFESGMLGTEYSTMDKIGSLSNVIDSRSIAKEQGKPVSVEKQIIAAQQRLAMAIVCRAEGVLCPFQMTSAERLIVSTLLTHHVYIPDFSFRIRLLINGMKGLSAAPWLGNGFGHFQATTINRYNDELEIYYYPHNIVVELLYSAGIIGTLLVFLGIVVLLWGILSTRYRICRGLPILMFVFSMLIGSLFAGDYTDFKLVWIGFLLTVMLIPSLENEENYNN